MEKEKNMEEEKKEEEDKGKGEVTFRTAPEFRKLFIEQCLAQVNEFGFAGTSLKPSSWTNLCKFFSAKYDCTFTQKKLRNHWDYLRKQYVIWTSLLAQTGHGYNAETNLFDWSDERWEAIGKSIKNSTQFRYKGLEDADLLRGLFDGKFSAGADRDTPGRSETSVPLSVGTSTMPAVSNNESGSRNSSLVKEKANVDDTEVDSNVGRSGKKRKKVAEEEASADLLTEKVCAMVNSMEEPFISSRPMKTLISQLGVLCLLLKQLKKTRHVRRKYKKSILTGKAFTQDLLDGNPRNMYNLLRMTKVPFLKLCNEFREKGLLEDSRYVEVEEKMAIFLYTIGHNCRNRVISYHFQHSGETISKYFHEVLAAMKRWSAEILVPRPNVYNKPAITKRHKRLREGAFKGAVGALDGTLISASIPKDKQTPYRGRGRGECSQNVLAICDWDMYFLYVVVGWEGTAHDSRVLNEAVRDPSFNFPLPPPAYSHTRGFMCPYRNIRYWLGDYRRVPPTAKEEKFNIAQARLRNVIERAFGVLKTRFPILSKMPSYSFETQRDIVIACMSIHNFLRHNALDDWLFKEYESEVFEMNEVQVDEEAEREERAPHLFGREEQVYMNNLRDEIARLL